LSPLRAAWSATWRITVFLIVWVLLLAPAGIPILSWLEHHHLVQAPRGRLALEACAAPTILIAAWLMLRFIDRRPFRTLGLDGRSPLKRVAWGIALGGGMMGAAVGALRLLDVAKVQAALEPHPGTLAIAGAAVMLNSLTQEVLVRGYVLQTLETTAGSFLAVLLSSAVFMFLHVVTIRGAWLPAFNLYLAGVLLGAAYVRTRSLWLPIGIHFGWNFLQGPLLGLTVSGRDLSAAPRVISLHGPSFLTGGAFGPEGGVTTTLATLLGGGVLAAVFSRRRRST
jgi:membrane protease YdiL (CAAX protease family)